MENITNEEFVGVTLAIFDTYGDDVQVGDGGDWYGGWQGGWHENTYLFEVILKIGDWEKIPLEDFSGETLLIGDTYEDDVRCVDRVLVMEVKF